MAKKRSKRAAKKSAARRSGREARAVSTERGAQPKGMINAWEDDPGAGAQPSGGQVVQRPVPVLRDQPFPTRIVNPSSAPAAKPHPLGGTARLGHPPIGSVGGRARLSAQRGEYVLLPGSRHASHHRAGNVAELGAALLLARLHRRVLRRTGRHGEVDRGRHSEAGCGRRCRALHEDAARQRATRCLRRSRAGAWSHSSNRARRTRTASPAA
jgi:hypothetical protein